MSKYNRVPLIFLDSMAAVIKIFDTVRKLDRVQLVSRIRPDQSESSQKEEAGAAARV